MKSTTFTICFTILATVFLAHLLATPESQAVAASVNAEASVTVQSSDVKTELGKKLKEHVDEVLEKIKDAIEHGKIVKEEYLEKLKEIKEKMKDHNIEMGKKAKELLEKIKEKAKDYWHKFLDKLMALEE